MRDVVPWLVIGMVEVVSEALNVLACGTIVASPRQCLDFGIYRLVQAAELQLLLLRRVQHLLCSALGGIQPIVVLVLLLRRRWVAIVVLGILVVHLRQHPVVHLELR